MTCARDRCLFSRRGEMRSDRSDLTTMVPLHKCRKRSVTHSSTITPPHHVPCVAKLLFLCGIIVLFPSSLAHDISYLQTERVKVATTLNIPPAALMSLSNSTAVIGHVVAQRQSSLNSPPNCSVNSTEADTSRRNNRLECFLWNLEVEIPQESFKKDFITITVHDMICSNFVIQGLESNYQPSEASKNTSFPQLTISVNQVEATCQGRYHSTGGLSGEVQAHVVQSQQLQLTQNTISDDPVHYKAFTAAFSLESTSSYPKVPSTCRSQTCATYLTCQGIHFSGSISARVIQAFSKSISKYITDALQTYICPKIIQQTATTSITKFLRHPFHDFVKKYLPKGDEIVSLSATSVREMESSSTATAAFPDSRNDNVIANVADYTTIRWFLDALNQQLRDHLQEGWIPFPSDEGELKMHGMSSSFPSSTLIQPSQQRLPQDCIDMFRGFSGFVKSIFGTKPSIQLPRYFQDIEILLPAIPGASISINTTKVSIEGLDQMEYLQILQPPERSYQNTPSNCTLSGSRCHDASELQSNLTSSSGFFLLIPITLEVSLPEKEPLMELFEVSLNVTHVQISLATVLQVSQWNSTSMLMVVDAVQKFTDSFRHGHQRDWKALACLISTLQKVEVHDWVVQLVVDSLRLSRDKEQTGSLDAEMDATINTILRLLSNEYKDLWTLLIGGIVDRLGTQKLNDFVRDWITSHAVSSSDQNFQQCATPFHAESLSSAPKWVNFTKFELLYKLNKFLGHSGRKKTLNHFLRCLGDTVELWNENDAGIDIVSARRHTPGMQEDWVSHFQDQITIARVETRYWDSLTELQILKPTSETTLSSSLIIGSKETLEEAGGQRAIQHQTSSFPEITFVVDFEGPTLLGQLNLTVFASVEGRADLQINYDLNRLENITISMLLDQAACGLLPTVDARILPNGTRTDLGKYIGLNLSGEINGKEFNVSTATFPLFNEIGSELLRWSIEWVRSSLNTGVAKWTSLAARQCPGVQMPSPENRKKMEVSLFSWLLSPLLSAILILILVLQFGLMWATKSLTGSPIFRVEQQLEDNFERSDEEDEVEEIFTRPSFRTTFQELIQPMNGTPEKFSKRNRASDTPSSLDRSIIDEVYAEMIEEEHPLVILEDQLYDTGDTVEEAKSIFTSTELPRFVPYILPAMIFGNIVLLFTSNVSVGASVSLSLRVAENYLEVPGIFQFSLGAAALKLFRAGAYPLLILVMFCSGIWPYIKLCWMLHACLVPCKDKHQRERRLVMLNALGKFSLVDSYVLILFVVAFRFHLELTESLGIDSFVIPVYGFYAFLAATCLSLVLGHALLFFHRKIATQDTHNDDTLHGKERILVHSFHCRDGDQPKQLNFFARALIIGLMLGTLSLLLAGFVQESFIFEFGGLAGAALGNDNSVISYSVLTLGVAIPQSFKDQKSLGAAILQLSYFAFTVFTPVTCLLVMLMLLMLPLSLKYQRKMLLICEAFNAWSAIEIFLLSIVAAVFQISRFAAFLIGDNCDSLNRIAEAIFDGATSDAVCFTVEASVNWNCWYLVVGTILDSWLMSFLLRMAHAAVEERTSNLSSEEDAATESAFRQPANHGWAVIQSLDAISVLGKWLFVPTMENLNAGVVRDENGPRFSETR